MKPLILSLAVLLSSCTAGQFASVTMPNGTKYTSYNGGSVATKGTSETYTSDITGPGGIGIHQARTIVGKDETSLTGQYFTFKGLQATIPVAQSAVGKLP